MIVATGAEPHRPWWVAGDADERRRRARRARRLGQSVRRRRRDRRDRLPPRHLGRRAARRPRLQRRDRHQRHGGRSGPRHHARHGELVDARRRQGHRPVDRSRADGHGAARRAATCCTTRPATMQPRTPDWVVLAVPAQPVEWLYHDLKATRRQRRDASATASRPGAPTPPSSTANGSEPRV